MKWLASFLLAASVALAACNPDNVIPDRTYDWCYEFDFVNADPMARTYGYWGDGIGYYTDGSNLLGITYSHSATVNPSAIEVGFRKAAAGDISVRAVGEVFGLSVDVDENIPALVPAGELIPYAIRGSGTAIGTRANVTISASGGLVVQFLRVYGMFENPFGMSNCSDNIVPTTGPATETATPLPTSEYTPTPLVSNTPTLMPDTPTPTLTTTPEPTWSPTPTYTPTPHLFLGPLQVIPFSAAATNDPLYGPRSDTGVRFGYDPSGQSSVVGWWMWLSTSGSFSWIWTAGEATPFASSNNYTIPTNLTPPAIPAHAGSSSNSGSHSDYPGGEWVPAWNSIGAQVQPTFIAGFVTQQAGAAVHQGGNNAPTMGTPAPGQAAYSGWFIQQFGATSGNAYGRALLVIISLNVSTAQPSPPFAGLFTLSPFFTRCAR